MTATDIWTPLGSYRVTGTGYDPTGHIEQGGARVRTADDPLLAELLQTAVTCNHAHLHREDSGKGGDWTLVGEPTEGALVVLAMKGRAPMPDPANALGEIPFSSERKRMSVLARAGEGCAVFAKGAPEAVLAAADAIAGAEGPEPLTEAHRHAVMEAYRDMASRGLRVIALADRGCPDEHLSEDRLTLLGLVGMIDPPRPEVRRAVADAHMAGIRVIMVTGDGPVTAPAIARQIGIAAAETVTGPELQAMTGDGVNDAPALKQADVGISMGQRGTEVAKDASDIVLLDDNFATILRAIREGRRQTDNVRKFVRYLLVYSCA